MKVIGIIGAMEEEVSMLKEKMTEVTVKEKAGGCSAFRHRKSQRRNLHPDPCG